MLTTEEFLKRVDHIPNYYQLLHSGDVFGALLMVFFLFALAFLLRKKLTGGLEHLRFWYFGGMAIYLATCLFSLFLFEKYFQSGDIFVYQEGCHAFVRAAWSDPQHVWTMLRYPPPEWSAELRSHFLLKKAMYFFERVPTALLLRPGGVLTLVFGGSFLAACLGFAGLSFFAGWLLFRHFALRFSGYRRWFFAASLMIPSAAFWTASGVMKEPLMIFSLAFFLTVFFELVERDSHRWWLWILLGAAFSVVFFIKFFVSIALFLAAAVFTLAHFAQADLFEEFLKKYFKSKTLGMAVLGGAVVAVMFGIYQLNVKMRTPKASNLLDDVKIVKNYNELISNRMGGSTYQIPSFDGSISSLAKAVFGSMGTTLFRPFFWESHRPMTYFAAVEALLTLLLTVFVLLSISPKNWWRTVWGNPTLASLLTFSLVTAVIIGYTSQNFGTLSRYKSLLLPFYFCALILFFWESKKQSSPPKSSN